ncbi:MAG: hypothetical protein KC646_06915 [Candidatus Cloacimonetes bacterium]|nr:hypothetical protein [Candidatus Cloacimonadota bacterium]
MSENNRSRINISLKSDEKELAAWYASKQSLNLSQFTKQCLLKEIQSLEEIENSSEVLITETQVLESSSQTQYEKLTKKISSNFSESEYELLSNIAKSNGNIPLSRLNRSIVLDYIKNSTQSSERSLEDIIKQVDELLAWKKEMEEFKTLLQSTGTSNIEDIIGDRSLLDDLPTEGLEKLDKALREAESKNKSGKDYIPKLDGVDKPVDSKV